MLNGIDLNGIALNQRGGVVAGILLRNINTRTITGTTETTMIPTSIVGSKTILPTDWGIGTTFRLFGSAILTIGNGVTGTLRVKIGGTTIVTSAVTFAQGITSGAGEHDIWVTYTDTNKVRVSGRSLIQTTTGLATPLMRGFDAIDVVINPAINNDFDVTYQFSGAGNTLDVREFNIAKF